MKRNLMSVIILALCVVNLILNALLVFVLMPASKKTDKLITEIASILDLELKNSTGGDATHDVANTAVYTLENDATINLKADGTGENHYAIVSLSVAMDTKAEDYTSISTALPTTESWMLDATRSVISSYTYAEINEPEIQAIVQKEILQKIQEKYNTTCIYRIDYKNFMTQ